MEDTTPKTIKNAWYGLAKNCTIVRDYWASQEHQFYHRAQFARCKEDFRYNHHLYLRAAVNRQCCKKLEQRAHRSLDHLTRQVHSPYSDPFLLSEDSQNEATRFLNVRLDLARKYQNRFHADTVLLEILITNGLYPCVRSASGEGRPTFNPYAKIQDRVPTRQKYNERPEFCINHPRGIPDQYGYQPPLYRKGVSANAALEGEAGGPQAEVDNTVAPPPVFTSKGRGRPRDGARSSERGPGNPQGD